ncbi:MAG: hypothetical protein SFV81_17350 [Pirellulaceae bacterium]|nr:hypothetical protein [Pirellulaceae bacterium]
MKERLFGLSGPEGNYGEDVKEVYFYVDAIPTHSYMKAVYKYPQCKFPYEQLTSEKGANGGQTKFFRDANKKREGHLSALTDHRRWK